MSQNIASAIDWPKVQIGAKTYTFRFTYSASYQLARWNQTIGTASNIELAAAMAGHFDAHGHWHSAGFERALDLADQISDLPDDQQQALSIALLEAIASALKKAFPALDIITPITPIPVPHGVPTTGSSTSGLSACPEVALV
jgi:hypothetical protein